MPLLSLKIQNTAVFFPSTATFFHENSGSGSCEAENAFAGTIMAMVMLITISNRFPNVVDPMLTNGIDSIAKLLNLSNADN